jgi:hypothetical protein
VAEKENAIKWLLIRGKRDLERIVIKRETVN